MPTDPTPRLLHIFGDESSHRGNHNFLVYGTVSCERDKVPLIVEEIEKAKRGKSIEWHWSEFSGRGRVLAGARFPPFMPRGIPDVLRPAASRFLDKYRSQLRPFKEEREVAPGVVVRRTGGHTPGHSVVRLASGKDRLTFLGDAVFRDHFDCPNWYNAFDHDPEEAVRVRVGLLQELAATRELLVAATVSFPFGRVAVAGDVFRFIPAYWEY